MGFLAPSKLILVLSQGGVGALLDHVKAVVLDAGVGAGSGITNEGAFWHRFTHLFARGVLQDAGSGLSLLLGVLSTQTYAQAIDLPGRQRTAYDSSRRHGGGYHRGNGQLRGGGCDEGRQNRFFRIGSEPSRCAAAGGWIIRPPWIQHRLHRRLPDGESGLFPTDTGGDGG